MTAARVRKENKQRPLLTVALSPELFAMIERLRQYPNQSRSDIVRWLIAEADRRRERAENEATA